MVRMNDSRNPVVILILIFPRGHGPFRAQRPATNGGARKWDEGSSELRLGYRASHHSTPTQLQTPHTIRTLRQQVNGIQSLHPDLSPSISRVFRGALAQAESLALSESLLDKFGEERQHREAASLKSKSYITTPNILSVRDAIRELDKKKSAEIEKIWKNHKDFKRLLKGINDRLDQPDHSRSSSPIQPNPASPTSSELFAVNPYPHGHDLSNY
jgi:hypothetical protein